MYQVDVIAWCGSESRKIENEFSGTMEECVRWANEIDCAVTEIDNKWFVVESCIVRPVEQK